MRFEKILRSGEYFRVADPDWADPLDASHSILKGGRWNQPGSFPVLYLNRQESLARKLVDARFKDLPYGLTDLREDRRPDLVTTTIDQRAFVDVVTEDGVRAVGLPPTYPLDTDGRPVQRQRCRPIGQAAWDEGHNGIACRSATDEATPDEEELVYFQRGRDLPLVERRVFSEWYRRAP